MLTTAAVPVAVVTVVAPIPVTSVKLARQFPVCNAVEVAACAPRSPVPYPIAPPIRASFPTSFQSIEPVVE